MAKINPIAVWSRLGGIRVDWVAGVDRGRCVGNAEIVVLAIVGVGGDIVAELVIRPVDIDELRIAAETVSVDTDLEVPIFASGEVFVFPVSKLARAGDYKIVVVAGETYFAVGRNIDRVALSNAQDVVVDGYVRGREDVQALFRMRTGDLNRIAG